MTDVPDSQLAARLLGPAGPEIGCDECLDLIDVFVEDELATGVAATHHPRMAAHLAGCPACADEYHSLLALVSDDGRT